MTETVELVTTKTYTVADLIQLLGEGKDKVVLSVQIPTRDRMHHWSTPVNNDEDVLRIVIREPAEVDKTEPRK